MKTKNSQKLTIIGILFLTAIFLMIILYNSQNIMVKKISNFEECASAGYAVMESYPRQCAANGQTFVEIIEKQYIGYGEECSRIKFICAPDKEFFSDEIGCGCESINDKKNFCPDESRGEGFCITLYDPVCGWNGPEIKCIKYPCASTYSNSCNACQNEDVLYYTQGTCPSG